MCVYGEREINIESDLLSLIYIYIYIYILYIYIYIYIYISSASCCAVSTDFPPPPAFRLYQLLLSAGLLDYNLCPYRAAVDKFLLVGKHLEVLTRGSV